MPITFDNEELFSSGPARVDVGGVTLRHAKHRPLSARGVKLFSQGLSGRTITQTGTLTADTPEALHAQIQAIERKLDGMPRTLVDDLDRTWLNVVMLAFEPAGRVRLGTRWKTTYRIEYLQPTEP